MNDVLSTIKEYWGITMGVIAFTGSYLWLKLDARYVKQTDLADIKKDVGSVKSRVTKMEEDLNNLPTGKDISELRLAVTEMRGETKAIHSELKGLNHLVNLLVEKEVKE